MPPAGSALRTSGIGRSASIDEEDATSIVNPINFAIGASSSWLRNHFMATRNIPAGNKNAGGLFGGLRTGPISWLGQVDITDDKSLPVQSGRQLATLLEANWRIAQGHNLKLTHEYLDPNRSVSNNGQTRYSIVYELTPIQYVQIRTGFRYSDGIPQSPPQHLKIGFVELHGFF